MKIHRYIEIQQRATADLEVTDELLKEITEEMREVMVCPDELPDITPEMIYAVVGGEETLRGEIEPDTNVKNIEYQIIVDLHGTIVDTCLFSHLWGVIDGKMNDIAPKIISEDWDFIETEIKE